MYCSNIEHALSVFYSCLSKTPSRWTKFLCGLSVFVAGMILGLMIGRSGQVIKCMERNSLTLDLEGNSNYLPDRKETNCCLMQAVGHRLEVLCQIDSNRPEMAQQCTCTDYMLCKLVMVTALSSNHFSESRDFFASVYSNFPAVKIIVYNIGLTTSEVERLKSYCNVMEIRDYKFDRYPNHTRELNRHAWKPFIFQEMSDEFEFFLYCDTSCRINKTFTSYFPILLKYPILLHAPKSSMSILRTTHESMIKYLVPDLNRSYLLKILKGFFESNAVLVWSTNYFKEKIMSPLLDCAMHQECISPKESKMAPCDFKGTAPDGYAGCHREQSAFNLLLMKDLGPSVQKLYDMSDEKFVHIVRYSTDHYNNSNSQHCGIYSSTSSVSD